MKTYKHLYARICAFDNLYAAFRKARKGKRRHPDVAAFEVDLEENLFTLQDQLCSETYRPGPYTTFTLYESKPRRISAAPFRDRVVHHALCNVIEPIWEKRFIHDSYACRKGKGPHAALDRCTSFARRFPYVLQCDIVQFFPSVDHLILLDLLARRIADPQALRLCRLIIESGAGIHADDYRMQWFLEDTLWAALRSRGLPIGNQTSQFWSNVYLHELDTFAKQTLRCGKQRGGYLRYSDDFLLFADDKPTLHRWRRAIEDFLQQLRLVVHSRKTRVYPVKCGIPFLGFIVFPDHRRLKRANGIVFQRKFKRQVQAYAEGRLSLKRLKASLQGWIAHAAHGDTYRLRASVLSKIPVSPPRSSA
jgi:retron-type reverse transcriptase